MHSNKILIIFHVMLHTVTYIWIDLIKKKTFTLSTYNGNVDIIKIKVPNLTFILFSLKYFFTIWSVGSKYHEWLKSQYAEKQASK